MLFGPGPIQRVVRILAGLWDKDRLSSLHVSPNVCLIWANGASTHVAILCKPQRTPQAFFLVDSQQHCFVSSLDDINGASSEWKPETRLLDRSSFVDNMSPLAKRLHLADPTEKNSFDYKRLQPLGPELTVNTTRQIPDACCPSRLAEYLCIP